jgi:phosphate transport system substrate-binding protein
MKISRLHPLTALALVLATGLAAACGGRGEETAAARSGGTVIQVDGSSTVFPVTEAVAEEFQKTNPGTRVTVGISGTGGGFQKFCRDEIDIADASRPIKPTEIEACGKAGVTFVELPVAYDGIAIVVNPNNTWVTSMTVAELKRLWEPDARGKILRWSHIRAGWPDREVHLLGAGTDSGTFDYFTEAVMGKSGASRSDYTSSEDDNTLVQGVSTDELALGYFGFAYYEENRNRLKLVPIDDGDETNGAGAIAPSPESIRAGSYRPLSRPIFIYAKTRALERPEVKDFVQFYLEKGGPLSREVGYVPLTDREYQLVRQRFDQRATGTMFTDGGHGTAALESILSAPR